MTTTHALRARMPAESSGTKVPPELTTPNYQTREIEELIPGVACLHVNVLLVGKTGTGKEHYARKIHDIPPRKNRRFLPVDCAGLPRERVEAELFGHGKGAFTGADADHDWPGNTRQLGNASIDAVTRHKGGKDLAGEEWVRFACQGTMGRSGRRGPGVAACRDEPTRFGRELPSGLRFRAEDGRMGDRRSPSPARGPFSAACRLAESPAPSRREDVSKGDVELRSLSPYLRKMNRQLGGERP